MPLPLAGIRILDNGIVQAGTFPSRLLADFGAEIVRVENYRSPDLSRNYVFPDGVAAEGYWEMGGTYHEQHRNKTYCVGIDAVTPRGREVFLRIAAACDVVVDSHPPGVLEKLGLGYADLQAAKPDTILLTTSGYGEGGPMSPMRSYGMMTEFMAVSWHNGYAGGPPRRGTIPLTDHPTTYHIAFLILAALVKRRRTGQGGWIDVSQYEVGLNLMGDAYLAHAMGAPVPARAGNVEPGLPFAGCFPCAGQDRWVALAPRTVEAFRALCRLVSLPALAAQDPWAALLSAEADRRLRDAVAAWTAPQDSHAAFLALQAQGIAAGPVQNVRDLLLNPHLEARDFWWLVAHHPRQRAGLRAFPGPAAHFSETPAELHRPAPLLGEHNRQICTGLLGYSEADYNALEASGAVGTRPNAADIIPPAFPQAMRTQMGPWAFGMRAKEIDGERMPRLRARFGPAYGT